MPVSAIPDVVPEALRGVFWGGSWAHDAAWMAKYHAHEYAPLLKDAAPADESAS